MESPHAPAKKFEEVVGDPGKVNSMFNSKFHDLNEKFGKNADDSARPFSPSPRGRDDIYNEQSERLVEEEIRRSRHGAKRDMDMTIHQRDLPFRQPR